MDRIGIQKCVVTIKYYMERQAIEEDMGEWGDPEMWGLSALEEMARLIQMCRGKVFLARRYFKKY